MDALRKIITGLFILTFIVSCSSSEKKVDMDFQLTYPKELDKAYQLLVKKKTLDALEKVNQYINKIENIHWYGHGYFLKAFIYESDNKFQQAIEFYRKAIKHGSQYESELEAKALYNLSFVYESMDERDQLLVTLIDLIKRKQYFSGIVGSVEIPARLAAAYASQGKIKEALIFHREATGHLTRILKNTRTLPSRDALAKSMYYLGLAVYDQNNESFKQLITKLSMGQKYFLASAEASKSHWSEKAKDRLMDRYQVAWGQVLEYKPVGYGHDPLAYKKVKHRKQLEMASDFYDLLFRLRAEEFPLSNVNWQSTQVMSLTSDWIAKVEDFAYGLDVGPETLRKTAIKNRKLPYVKEFKPPTINKEVKAPSQPSKVKKTPAAKKDLPPKEDIGKDPNL